jgi:hypothetical protein
MRLDSFPLICHEILKDDDSKVINMINITGR